MKRLLFFVLQIFFLPFVLFSLSLSFEQIGEYEGNAVYTDVEVSGRYAFLLAGNKGVHIFDVSNTYFPKKISVIESMDRSYAIDVEGFNLYVADGMAGVRIFDIRDSPDFSGSGWCRGSACLEPSQDDGHCQND